VKVVVGLSGYRGSGKSWVANELVSRYGFTSVSFGDAVRAEAVKRGIDQEVETLQALGTDLIKEWGVDDFCRHVLNQAPYDRNLVLDGIRHIDVLEALRELAAPRRFVSVFIEIGESERRRRLRQRDQDDGVTRDSHVVESEVGRLRELADFVTDGAPDLAERLIARLSSNDSSWKPPRSD
jgi:adenylate kinase family enzyme